MDRAERRRFLQSFARLCGMIVLQNVITLSVNLADNVMIGRYSEISLSGVATVNQIQFILQSLVGGVGNGLVMLSSQYWGRGKTEPIRRLTAVAMRIGLAVAAVIFALVTLLPRETVTLFSNDPEVISEGVRYLKIVSFTYIPFAITWVLLSMLQSVEIVKIATKLSLVTLVVNCSLNFVLIEGRFGAPRLGVRGAAVATLAARLVELALATAYVLRKEKNVSFRFGELLHRDGLLAKDYWRVSLPLLLTGFLWGFSNALRTVILGHMSTAAIAANSVVSTVYELLKVAAVGASSAAAIVIGKAVGAGDISQVKVYAKYLQRIFLGIGIFIFGTLLALKNPVIRLYDLSDETSRLANEFMWVMAAAGWGMAYQMPTAGGIIRGGGDSSFVMKNDLISIWGIVLPVSFAAAFWLHLSPTVVMACLNSDQVFKCVPVYLHVRKEKWIKKLTR